MEVSRIRALRGPNLWSRHTAIEAIVACSADERDAAPCARLRSRGCARFPGASDALRGDAGDIRWRTCWPPPRSRLQAQAGCPVTFSRTCAHVRGPASTRWWSSTAKKTSAAWRWSWPKQLIDAAVNEQRFDLDATVANPARHRRRRAPRPQHRLHRRRRRGARHPVPPPDPGQPGAVRLGREAAPHPGRRSRSHQRSRRIHRPGQGADQDAAARRRRAGAHGPAGARIIDDACVGGRRDRLAGGASSRRTATRARA